MVDNYIDLWWSSSLGKLEILTVIQKANEMEVVLAGWKKLRGTARLSLRDQSC